MYSFIHSSYQLISSYQARLLLQYVCQAKIGKSLQFNMANAENEVKKYGGHSMGSRAARLKDKLEFPRHVLALAAHILN